MVGTDSRTCIGFDNAVLWRDLFVGRITQLRGQLRSDLVGTVQFEVSRGSGESLLWYLEIALGSVQAHEGLSPHFDEWVSSTEGDLGALLFGGAEDPVQLRTIGHENLLGRLLSWMSNRERPRRAGVWRGDES